jgi:putative spermidine/putrescine transport system ATP-binding protein
VTQQAAPGAVVASADPTGSTTAVELAGVFRHFGEIRAVDGIDLTVDDGEFFSLLGPSGSGKTTTLRMIAGFEHPDAGRLLLHGRDVSRLAPYERDVNTVFQDYALFPHMSVGDNVGYGLMVRRVTRAERAGRVSAALDMVQLEGYEARRVGELSGGQRQRVALARALVNQPSVLLLDEPLGALDLKLRQRMQLELKAIQQKVGITFIYVTHDQEEALTMSDRLAVFNHGRIEQVGRPADVYERPASAFVASFVGMSNFVDADVACRLTGHAGAFTLRPERIRLADLDTATAPEEASATAVVREVIYLGVHSRFVLDLDVGGELTVVRQNLDGFGDEVASYRGTRVRAVWKRSAGRFLETDAAPAAAQREEAT